MRSEKPICAPFRLSEVSPTLRDYLPISAILSLPPPLLPPPPTHLFLPPSLLPQQCTQVSSTVSQILQYSPHPSPPSFFLPLSSLSSVPKCLRLFHRYCSTPPPPPPPPNSERRTHYSSRQSKPEDDFTPLSHRSVCKPPLPDSAGTGVPSGPR